MTRRSIPTTTIPVIDLCLMTTQTQEEDGDSVLLADDEESSNRLAGELVDALETYGFATLINHGIPSSLVESAFEASRKFFALDTTVKQQYAYRGHDSNCGYIGVGQEHHDEKDYNDDALEGIMMADVKETFDVGPEPISCDVSDGDGTPWPSEAEECVGPHFKSALVNYFEECNRLQLRLLKLIAVGLGLPTPGALASQCDERHCNLRLLRYPSVRVRVGTASDSSSNNEEEEKVVVRGARHTDFGTLTLLAQDGVGGLRVQPRAAATVQEGDDQAATTASHAPWIHVTPVEGSIVLDVGDMLERWTNGRLVATPHQVVSVLPPTTTKEDPHHPTATEFVIPERYSIAFFCNANKDTVLRPLPLLVKAHEKPKYEDVTAIEYLTRRLTETIRPAA